MVCIGKGQMNPTTSFTCEHDVAEYLKEFKHRVSKSLRNCNDTLKLLIPPLPMAKTNQDIVYGVAFDFSILKLTKVNYRF